ncbi:MAG TPA: hypothetical protein DDW52_03555 [Planctomycetaceae bacterium]|nr:hypothetical protein [Planctomycetaceae bacterium]
MQLPPETRSSLIANLQTATNQDAWHDFVELYEPFIYRQAVASGLQPADAGEVVQGVLLAVSQAIGGFTPDAGRARFRTWLYAVGRNICLQQLGRLRRNQTQPLPEALDIDDSAVDRVMQLDLRRRAFRWAADRVRGSFTDRTWHAFWRSSVDHVAVADVARELDMSVGAVYIARSRVMERLRQEVQQIDPSDFSSESPDTASDVGSKDRPRDAVQSDQSHSDQSHSDQSQSDQPDGDQSLSDLSLSDRPRSDLHRSDQSQSDRSGSSVRVPKEEPC